MNKSTAAILFAISSSLFFTSCKKTSSEEQPMNLNGIVADYTTRQPIAGIKVYLSQSFFTIGTGITNPHWLVNSTDTAAPVPFPHYDSTITDNKGKFSFTFSRNICSNLPCIPLYVPVVTGPAYIMLHHYAVPTNYVNGDTVFMDRPAYLKINFQKSTPATMGDTLFAQRYFYNALTMQGYSFFKRSARIGITGFSITDTLCYQTSNQLTLEWRHYKNGLVSTATDTITLAPNTTTIHNVTY